MSRTNQTLKPRSTHVKRAHSTQGPHEENIKTMSHDENHFIFLMKLIKETLLTGIIIISLMRCKEVKRLRTGQHFDQGSEGTSLNLKRT